MQTFSPKWPGQIEIRCDVPQARGNAEIGRTRSYSGVSEIARDADKTSIEISSSLFAALHLAGFH